MVRLLAFILVSVCAQYAFTQDSLSESGALQGTWSLIEQQIDGKTNPNRFRQFDVTFADHNVSLVYETHDGVTGNRDAKMRFTVNTATIPKQMNWFGELCLFQAVYTLDGDKLTIAHFGLSEFARPDNLNHEKTSRSIDSPHILWELQRQAPDALKTDTKSATPLKNGK